MIAADDPLGWDDWSILDDVPIALVPVEQPLQGDRCVSPDCACRRVAS